MKINDFQFNCELSDIISEMQNQLAANNIQLLQKTVNSSKDIMIQCPYHGNGQERKPSAGIRKEDGLFHCFACGEVHSLQEVISHCFGHTDDMIGAWGWNWLLRNFATIQIEERKDVKLDYIRNKGISDRHSSNNSVATIGNTDRLYITEEELDKYRYIHPYWATRGITEDWLIELFDLGYDKETDCITFPIRDINGNCLFVARRSVKTKFFNYPEDVEKPLYGLYELKLALSNGRGSARVNIKPVLMIMYGELYVTESMIDCLRLWQIGKYAVAMNGTGSEKQFEDLKNLPCRKIILATDSDNAGTKAREKIRHNVRNKIITEIILPKGRKDIGECSDEELRNLEEVF